MNTRSIVLTQLTDLICTIDRSYPVRVAIDGVDASGKTTLANELAPLIENRGRPVIRASVDGFHNPRELRYRRGQNSPEGYYLDSFDYETLQRDLLIPLGPGGNRKYRRTAFNYWADAPSFESVSEAPANAILLLDGIFLLRPELIQYWDFSIFVNVDFDVSVSRALARDVARIGADVSLQSTLAQYNQRYVPGQKIYLAEACPDEKAAVVIRNNDLENPELLIS